MGNTCIPVVNSCCYMAKPIQYCKVTKYNTIKKKLKKKTKKKKVKMYFQLVLILMLKSILLFHILNQFLISGCNVLQEYLQLFPLFC